MKPDDLLCSRSARPQKGLARRPQSKAPHALAWLSIEWIREPEWITEYRKRIYPELAARVDVGSLSVLDMIDMDEGRLPIKG